MAVTKPKGRPVRIGPVIGGPLRPWRGLPSVRLSPPQESSPRTITFPASPLAVRVEAALGADLTANPASWWWENVTPYVFTRDSVSITRGRQDESSVADASRCSMTVSNTTGIWSTRNANGAWYGQLRKGTPLRVYAEGYIRYAGFLSEIRPRWDVSGRDRYAELVAQGLFYRLAQGASPARSALRRSILANDPAVYWPLEDDLGATVGASGLPDGTTIEVSSGVVDFGSFTDLIGATKTPDTSAGSLKATITGVTGTSWYLEFCLFGFPSGNGATARLYTNGTTYNILRFFPPSAAGQSFTVFISDDAGDLTGITGPTVTDDWGDAWHHVAITAEQSGGNVAFTLYVDGVVAGSTSATTTLGSPTTLLLNQNLEVSISQESFAHVALGNGTAFAGADALDGYDGEDAATRFLRLCTEEGIPATCVDAESAQLGPQLTDTLLNLLRELEAADAGFLYESFDFGLTYRSHTSRENIPAALALDYDVDGHISPPLEPTDDDQQVRNDVEVKRKDGSSSRLTEEDSNVELSIPNIGRRDTSNEYNLYRDSQTYIKAGLELHLGTWAGYRIPVLTLNFATVTGPTLIPLFCTADLAFRTTIANPPDDIGQDGVDLVVEGYTETLNLYDWDISANCSPYGPWHIFRTAEDSGDSDPFLGYLIPDSCVLAEDLDTTETGVDITSTPLWSTSSDDWTPGALVTVDGEHMLVTAVSGGSNPQTLTVTRSVNGVVKTHSSGARLEFVSPGVLGY